MLQDNLNTLKAKAKTRANFDFSPKSFVEITKDIATGAFNKKYKVYR
jgi:hypothetical protein